MDILEAKIDDLVLPLATIRDNIDNSLVERGLPLQNGAVIQNMGENARRIKFRAVFIGQNYADHITLMDSARSQKVLVLSLSSVIIIA